MKVVQPIRDPEVLERCYEIAREHDRNRRQGSLCWELMLIVGLNTSLRVSDFTRFRVGELRGKEYAQIDARKTGKEARILINPAARWNMAAMGRQRSTSPAARQPRPSGCLPERKRPL